MAGVVGVLRASCVYLPMEPHTPAKRAAQLLSLSSVAEPATLARCSCGAGTAEDQTSTLCAALISCSLATIIISSGTSTSAGR